MIDCMINSAAYVARVTRGFGVDRLYRLISGASDEMNGVFSWAETVENNDLDTVLTSSGSMRAELKRYGVDYRKLRDSIPIPDRFGTTWRNEYERGLHERRVGYLTTLAVAQEPIHAGLLICAHNEYQYGKARLEQFYRDIRADYDLFVTEYLDSRPESEQRIHDMLKVRKDALEECGLRIS
jgi:hypothetical protein